MVHLLNKRSLHWLLTELWCWTGGTGSARPEQIWRGWKYRDGNTALFMLSLCWKAGGECQVSFKMTLIRIWVHPHCWHKNKLKCIHLNHNLFITLRTAVLFAKLNCATWTLLLAGCKCGWLVNTNRNASSTSWCWAHLCFSNLRI